MSVLQVEKYSGKEVAAKKLAISNRMAVAGGTAVVALGLFNLTGCASDDEHFREPATQIEEQSAQDEAKFSKIERLNSQIEALKDQIRVLKTQDLSKDTQINSLNDQIDSLNDQIDSLNAQIEALRKKIEYLVPPDEKAAPIVPDPPTIREPDPVPGGSGSWFVSILERI